MIKKSFDCFTVYEEVDNNVFIHIEMKDEEAFYEKLFDYFFSEDKLLRELLLMSKERGLHERIR